MYIAVRLYVANWSRILFHCAIIFCSVPCETGRTFVQVYTVIEMHADNMFSKILLNVSHKRVEYCFTTLSKYLNFRLK